MEGWERERIKNKLVKRERKKKKKKVDRSYVVYLVLNLTFYLVESVSLFSVKTTHFNTNNTKLIKMLVWRQFFTLYQLARKALPIYHNHHLNPHQSSLWIITKAKCLFTLDFTKTSSGREKTSGSINGFYLILDLDFYFCMILDGFWLFMKKMKRKIIVLRKLIWVLNSGWIPCVMSQWSLSSLPLSLSLSLQNPTKMFYFHFISHLCLSFRLTPEVCFI